MNGTNYEVPHCGAFCTHQSPYVNKYNTYGIRIYNGSPIILELIPSNCLNWPNFFNVDSKLYIKLLIETKPIVCLPWEILHCKISREKPEPEPGFEPRTSEFYWIECPKIQCRLQYCIEMSVLWDMYTFVLCRIGWSLIMYIWKLVSINSDYSRTLYKNECRLNLNI